MRFVFIHGNGGGVGDDIWKPWLRLKLEELGHEVVNPTFPDNVEAKSAIWLPYLHDTLNADENTILVGHSSGAEAAMRYAQTYRIKGSFLVGACHTDLDDPDEKVSGYYDSPWEWDKIRNNQDFIVMFSSIDDPWINIEEPRFVRRQLRCEYHEYTDKGHFMPYGESEDSWRKFPELLQVILNYLD